MHTTARMIPTRDKMYSTTVRPMLYVAIFLIGVPSGGAPSGGSKNNKKN